MYRWQYRPGLWRHAIILQSVRRRATHQSRSRMVSSVQLTHICSKACSLRDMDFVCSNAVYQYRLSALSFFTAVAFCEISSTTALRKLPLAIEIRVTVSFRRCTDPQSSQVYSDKAALLKYRCQVVCKWPTGVEMRTFRALPNHVWKRAIEVQRRTR